MADTFGSGTMAGSGTTAYKFPSFRTIEENKTQPFDIAGTDLFKQASQTAQQQMGGNVEGFDQQANIARDAFKAAQASAAKAKREQLMGFGMRDTGQYINEGIIGPADQEAAAKQELERNLAAQRQEQIRQQQQAGMAGASNLLGLQAQTGLGYAQIASNENVQAAQLAQNQQQFTDRMSFDKWATEAGFSEAEKERTWQTLENQKSRESQEAQQLRQIASTEKISAAGIASGEKIAGMEIASREKIASDQTYLAQQGIDLDKAQLYGYTDENGNRVMGSAEIAGQQLGLQGKTVQAQIDELYGYTDPNTGQRVQGKMELLSAQDQREAARLYGYDDDQGNHIMGELEIAQDRNAIERQGLKIEEAKAFGYTDDNGTYHPGAMEIEMKKLGLDTQRFDADRLALFGGTDPVTGQKVEGTLSMKARELGLQGETVELQRNELFGYTDPKTGEFTPGKYQLMNAEQQRAADELYGYYDKTTGEYVPGSFGQEKALLELKGNLEIELTKAGIDYATVIGQIENMEPDQAAEMIRGIADQYGVTIPDMTATRGEAAATAMAGYQMARAEGKPYTLSDDAVQAIKYSDRTDVVKDNSIEGSGINNWVDGVGVKNHWSVNDTARAWANENKGKVYVASNGRVYEIVGVHDKDERHYRAGIEFKDLQTNQIVRINDQQGFPTSPMNTGE